MTSTIFAVASGAAPCAIAIIRVAGPGAFAAVARLSPQPLPAARSLLRRDLIDPADGTLLDRAMVVCFPAPASATGDDMVELHLHGSRAVIAAIGRCLKDFGLFAATPGAFTRRAFDNGKLDLDGVEALGDLLAAETEAQRRLALRGGVSSRLEEWRAAIIGVAAGVAARLDFFEDDDREVLTEEQRETLATLVEQLDDAIRRGSAAVRVRDGVTVAIIGPVNAGKSTLLNALANRDAAIVSPYPGTTRDCVEARVVIDGILFTLIDTAGMRNTGDPIEIEGIRRGRNRAATCDIVIAIDDDGNHDAIRVVSKGDLRVAATGWREGVLHLSATRGDGLDLLTSELSRRAASLSAADDATPRITEHQLDSLRQSRAAILKALASSDLVVTAHWLDQAVVGLGSRSQERPADDVLDAVFARFCIGK